MNNTEICCNCKFFKNSTHYCRCLEKKTSCRDTCGSFEFNKPVDWEQRRYEIAKDVYCIRQTHYLDSNKKMAEVAVIAADALIEELKRPRQ